MATDSMSLNDFPDEIILEILSYLEPDDLIFNIPELGHRWGALAKNETLWKKLTYKCDYTNHNRVFTVRCTTFWTNLLTNFVPSGVLKVRNLKEDFRNWTSFHADVRQVSRGFV
jgi:hypothetical protein